MSHGIEEFISEAEKDARWGEAVLNHFPNVFRSALPDGRRVWMAHALTATGIELVAAKDRVFAVGFVQVTAPAQAEEYEPPTGRVYSEDPQLVFTLTGDAARLIAKDLRIPFREAPK